jgi:site-specific DNA-cytosine methylase
MLEFSWAHLTGDTVYKVGVCSPPCPPWSKAAVVPRGFRRRDGALAPLAVALLPLVGCKTSALENLSGLLQHDHWHVVNVWIASWNLTSRGPRFLTWLML